MQTRSSDENYVSPSVCLFVKRVHCDKTEDFFILYERLIIYPSFLRRRMVGGGRSLLPYILGQPAAVRAKSSISNQ